MKVILFVLFLLVISSTQALNHHDGFVESRNDHKHELSLTIRKGGGGFGGGGRGGGGFGGAGKGGGGGKGGSGRGGGGFGGAVAGGIIGGVIGGTIANGGNNGGYSGGYDGNDNSATTLSAVPHFCVSTLILCMSFWL